jgi:TetR/AcrR family transcriptional regulator, transcriptional repressor for nem operon
MVPVMKSADTAVASSDTDAKTRLLDAALHVIRAKGYAGARVDDVCAAAGLSKGAFFHHFATKEDLALAAAAHFSQRSDTVFAEAPYQRIADPLERLLAYLDYRASLMQGDLPDFTCLLGTMVQETYDTSPAIRAACDRYIRWHASAVAKDIAESKRRYAPRARWSAESLALHIQAAMQGAFILAKARHDPQAATDSMRHLRRYVEMLFDHPTTKGD